MCGLFGWSLLPHVKFPLARMVAAATVLALKNEQRGTHSWGTFTPDGKLVKSLGGIATNTFIEIAKKQRNLAAHTRFATHGKPNIDNAHPFQIGRITGAHNGVLSNHGELNWKNKREFEVDSMHLFAHLDEGKPFTDIEGYGTMVWLDSYRPGMIFLCRMAGGDLCVVKTKIGIFWSSTQDAVATAMELAGLDWTRIKADEGEELYVEGGKIYTNGIKHKIVQETKYTWEMGGSYTSSGKSGYKINYPLADYEDEMEKEDTKILETGELEILTPFAKFVSDVVLCPACQEATMSPQEIEQALEEVWDEPCMYCEADPPCPPPPEAENDDEEIARIKGIIEKYGKIQAPQIAGGGGWNND